MIEMVGARIAAVFNQQFAIAHRTVMVGGSVEPLYLPATGIQPALVVYTRDYPASALHEAAHWCLAGARRRRRRDYGYSYSPGPRDPAQRRAFFAAELDVQALEAVFASAADVRFVISADDFEAPACELDAFAQRVRQRAAAYAHAFVHERGPTERAARFCAALAAERRGPGD